MLQAGLNPEIAKGYTNMGAALEAAKWKPITGKIIRNNSAT